MRFYISCARTFPICATCAHQCPSYSKHCHLTCVVRRPGVARSNRPSVAVAIYSPPPKQPGVAFSKINGSKILMGYRETQHHSPSPLDTHYSDIYPGPEISNSTEKWFDTVGVEMLTSIEHQVQPISGSKIFNGLKRNPTPSPYQLAVPLYAVQCLHTRRFDPLATERAEDILVFSHRFLMGSKET